MAILWEITIIFIKFIGAKFNIFVLLLNLHLIKIWHILILAIIIYSISALRLSFGYNTTQCTTSAEKETTDLGWCLYPLTFLQHYSSLAIVMVRVRVRITVRVRVRVAAAVTLSEVIKRRHESERLPPEHYY